MIKRIVVIGGGIVGLATAVTMWTNLVNRVQALESKEVEINRVPIIIEKLNNLEANTNDTKIKVDRLYERLISQ